MVRKLDVSLQKVLKKIFKDSWTIFYSPQNVDEQTRQSQKMAVFSSAWKRADTSETIKTNIRGLSDIKL